MPDALYLDGSQPYHRHPSLDGPHLPTLVPGRACGSRASECVPVHLFDGDALALHDEAVRRDTDAGDTEAPRFDPDHPEPWSWAWVMPPDMADDDQRPTVAAGWDDDGAFHRYVSPERLCRLFREYLEQDQQR